MLLIVGLAMYWAAAPVNEGGVLYPPLETGNAAEIRDHDFLSGIFPPEGDATEATEPFAPEPVKTGPIVDKVSLRGAERATDKVFA